MNKIIKIELYVECANSHDDIKEDFRVAVQDMIENNTNLDLDDTLIYEILVLEKT